MTLAYLLMMYTRSLIANNCHFIKVLNLYWRWHVDCKTIFSYAVFLSCFPVQNVSETVSIAALTECHIWKKTQDSRIFRCFLHFHEHVVKDLRLWQQCVLWCFLCRDDLRVKGHRRRSWPLVAAGRLLPLLMPDSGQ